MSHDDAFLRAIIDSPDDDGPRLLYADWLEERGDPRGEFIRVQCAIAVADPGDPRFAELRLREGQLLAAHASEWARPLPGRARSWVFRRGFVEEVTIDVDAFLDIAD